MDVRILSLDPSSASELVTTMRTVFPTADVRLQQAIDVRGSPSEVLLRAQLISHSVYHTLTHGRRWHHEVPTKGAVGLAQANRLALSENLTRPLLLLEEDCIVKDPTRFRREVQLLLEYQEMFDMAAFGALYRGAPGGAVDAAWLPEGFQLLRDKFWLLHCVLYTPSGRRRVSDLLARPLEMQIDSWYGSVASVDQLRIVGQTTRWSAVQRVHASTVQESVIRQARMRMSHTTRAVVLLLTYFVVCRYTAFRRASARSDVTP